MKRSLSFLAAVLISGSAIAHEGHDQTPGSLAAPHGGIVQGTSNLYLELVTSKNDVKLYPLDHDSKPVPLGDVKIDAKMTVPRKGKPEKVSFMVHEDHYMATIDPKGAHRYQLDVEASYKGKKEKVKFNIEPQ